MRKKISSKDKREATVCVNEIRHRKRRKLKEKRRGGVGEEGEKLKGENVR